jgi:hypothetical protein
VDDFPQQGGREQRLLLVERVASLERSEFVYHSGSSSPLIEALAGVQLEPSGVNVGEQFVGSDSEPASPRQFGCT